MQPITRAVFRIIHWGSLATAALSLGGCVGGSIAQQLASSFAMHAADRITAGAIEQYELNQQAAQRNAVLQDNAPDEYWGVFVTSGFSEVAPIIEPVPQDRVSPQTASITAEANPLVRVEVWNLLIGEEKIRVLEKARLQGAPGLPPKHEWERWQVAAGALVGNPSQPLLFLIPPQLDRLVSGELAVVELAGPGELSYARYALN